MPIKGNKLLLFKPKNGSFRSHSFNSAEVCGSLKIIQLQYVSKPLKSYYDSHN